MIQAKDEIIRHLKEKLAQSEISTLQLTKDVARGELKDLTSLSENSVGETERQSMVAREKIVEITIITTKRSN